MSTKMMSEGSFPVENKCFRVFLDVIECFFFSPNYSQMRSMQAETRVFGSNLSIVQRKVSALYGGSPWFETNY